MQFWLEKDLKIFRGLKRDKNIEEYYQDSNWKYSKIGVVFYFVLFLVTFNLDPAPGNSICYYKWENVCYILWRTN